MKKMLKKVTSLESALRFFDEDGNITDVSNLRGDVSNLRGNVSYLLRGDVDDCEITKDERNAGVNIEDLIA